MHIEILKHPIKGFQVRVVERHDEIELLRIVGGVFEARGLQFAASQVRRAIARVEQGT